VNDVHKYHTGEYNQESSKNIVRKAYKIIILTVYIVTCFVVTIRRDYKFLLYTSKQNNCLTNTFLYYEFQRSMFRSLKVLYF